MASLRKDCPVCETSGVINVFSAPECRNCEYKWASYTDFRDMFIGRKPAPSPTATPAPAPVVEDNYITSGQLQRDVQDAIDLATSKGVTRGARERTVLIGRELGRIGMDATASGKSEKQTLDEIYVFITKMMKDEMQKFDEEMGNA